MSNNSNSNLKRALTNYINAKSKGNGSNLSSRRNAILRAINSEMNRAVNLAKNGQLNAARKAAENANAAARIAQKPKGFFGSLRNRFRQPGLMNRMRNKVSGFRNRFRRNRNNGQRTPLLQNTNTNNNRNGNVRQQRVNYLRSRFGNNSISSNIENNKLNKLSKLAQNRPNVNLDTLIYISMLSPSQLNTYNSLDNNNRKKLINNYSVSNFNSGYRNLIASKAKIQIKNANGNQQTGLPIPRIDPPPSNARSPNNSNAFAVNFNRGPLNQMYRNQIPNNKQRANFINYVLSRNNKGKNINLTTLQKNYQNKKTGSLI
jgi:hypothetical protein